MSRKCAYHNALTINVDSVLVLIVIYVQSTDALPTPPPELPYGHHSGVSVSTSGEYIVKVTGKIRLPGDIPPNLRNVGDEASFWVGITANLGSQSPEIHLVQAGVMMNVDEWQEVTFRPFVEWFPDPLRYTMSMSGGSLKAGDVIEVTVQMINAWQANITFRNHNDPSGKSLRWNRLMYSNTDREKPFYGTDVGWIAEAPPRIRTGRIYIPHLPTLGKLSSLPVPPKRTREGNSI
ncbi:hypothetical protein C8R42DRAFT_643788 [Lentinula raphanica]|nr:hypothetical protein C8R42DRAFT_643788 [Lentinula raphanica]